MLTQVSKNLVSCSSVMLPRRQSFPLEGHAHEFTFSTYRRRPFFADSALARCFCTNLMTACQDLSLELWAFVVMPNHCHVLVKPKEREYEIPRILKELKSPVAKQAFALRPDIREMCMVERSGRKPEYRLWQPGGGYDRNIYSEEAAKNAIEYIHQNPVKKELCNDADTWEFSSAKAYAGIVTPWKVDRFIG